MDPSKYYNRSRFGDYAIHFSNSLGIPQDEVENIFSQFGDVRRVSQTGGPSGLCFINFKEEEHAIKAIKGIEFHDRIKLREVSLINPSKKERADNSDGNHRNFSKSHDDTTSERSFRGGGDRRKHRNDSSSSSRNFNNRNKDNSNNNDNRNFSWDQKSPKKSDGFKSMNNDNSNNNSNNFAWDQKSPKKSDGFKSMNNDKAFGSNRKLFGDDSVKETKKTDDFDHDKASDIAKTKQQETKVVPEEPKKQPEIPALIQVNSISTCSPVINDIPDLISSEISLQRVNPMLEIQAEEIIVGNIPNEFGIHYILNLFDKFKPLAATFIKNTKVFKDNSLRYCHVYFPSAKIADAVEKQFDHFNLTDSKLIVIRAQKLAAQFC